MSGFFSPDYAGPPFAILGAPHIAALAAIALLNLVLTQFKNANAARKCTTRRTLAITLWAAELSWHGWKFATGTWTIREMLPLNLCSLLIWLSGFMILFRNFQIYEFAYFLGIGSAIQYLSTPDLGQYGFPHFRFFQAFASHGLLLTGAIYMTAVEGFRPTWKSLGRVVVWTNIYAVLVYLLNVAIGSDYLMLNAKPATPSLLDLLPPWPYYLIYMELIGILTCILLYLPFLIADYRAHRIAGQS
jgi:hypothetical integral membrane protein (TIGR02206 family)